MSIKKKLNKVKPKPVNSKSKKNNDILGVDIANNAAAKRRITEEKSIKKRAIKKSKVERPKAKAKSYSNYKIKKIILKTILGGGILCAIIFLIIFMENMHLLGITTKPNVDKKDSILIEMATGNNDMYAYQNELLVYSNGVIRTYSKYGKKTWEYKFTELFKPDIKVSGKYIQITNKDSGYIYIFENKYEQARTKINGDIKETNINKSGDTAVLYSSPGVKASISIYSKRGKELYKVKLDNSNIANLKLSDNLRYIAFVEVITEGVSISESVNIVDLSNDSKLKTIKKVALEIVYGLDIRGDYLDIITDNAVYSYNIKNNKNIEEKLVNKNIIYIDYEDKNLATISKKTDSDAKSQLTMKKIGSKKEKILDIEGVPKNFRYKNNLSYITYQKHIEIYNNFGVKIKTYTSDQIILNISVFNNGKSIAVPYSNKIEIINI